MATLLLLVGVLGGCADLAGMAPSAARTVEAPAYRVGDRWVYRAEDGLRIKITWEETREIVARDRDGHTLRVTQRGPAVSTERSEIWSAPGRLRAGAVFDDEMRRFRDDLRSLQFPLASGDSWNQWAANYNEQLRRDGNINRYARVRGWRTVSTPAGSFDAIEVLVEMRLDDEEFWRQGTHCLYRLWYAPAVRGFVREQKDAWWQESNIVETGRTQSQHAVLELVSFTPGKD